MNKKKSKFLNILFLAAALCLSSILILVVPACTTNRQGLGFNTLYTLEKSTVATYDAYLGEVYQGRLPTNDVPQVTKAFNAFQASMEVALDAVQYNTNALAPPNLERSSQDLIRMIEAVKRARR